MNERKLVTIRKISEIKPIENADAIEVAVVDGWNVVVKKGEFKEGDYCIYCEIDSWIPTEIAPFLSKGKEPREYNGVKGEKLRTIRLRGQLSQGLLLPVSEFKDKFSDENEELDIEYAFTNQMDLASILGVIKYEPAIPVQLSGIMKGSFPSFIRRTNQDRVQNIWKDLKNNYSDVRFEASIKLDGTSFTCYHNNGEFGVCSRNIELLEDINNTYWKTANQYDLKEKLSKVGRNIAIQGEIIGENIQSNKDKLKGQHLYIFSIWDIDAQRYMHFDDICEVVTKLNDVGTSETFLKIVPIVPNPYSTILKTTVAMSEFNTIEDILKFAEGPSINSDCREGLVFKSKEYISGDVISFKVISNQFLLKYD